MVTRGLDGRLEEKDPSRRLPERLERLLGQPSRDSGSRAGRTLTGNSSPQTGSSVPSRVVDASSSRSVAEPNGHARRRPSSQLYDHNTYQSDHRHEPPGPVTRNDRKQEQDARTKQ